MEIGNRLPAATFSRPTGGEGQSRPQETQTPPSREEEARLRHLQKQEQQSRSQRAAHSDDVGSEPQPVATRRPLPPQHSQPETGDSGSLLTQPYREVAKLGTATPQTPGSYLKDQA